MKIIDEFIVFSDLHAHNFPYGATQVAIPGFVGLFNSRLRDTYLVLDYIHNYAASNEITKVFFGGDLFHSRKSVSVDVSHVISKKLHEISSDTDLFLLKGNHDMGNKVGSVSSLFGLPGTVILEPTIYDSTNYAIAFVPYIASKDDLHQALLNISFKIKDINKPKVLLSHLGIKGAKVGSDYVLVSSTDISIKDVPDIFDLCLFGHFHEHQKVFKNGWYIGATHQHNWGEESGKRGFLHVRLYDNGSFKFKRIETNAPKFRKVYTDEDLNKVKHNDFVRYYTDQEKDFSSLKEKHGLSNLEPVHIALENSSEEDLELDTIDINDILRVWIDHKKEENNKSELLRVGKELLAGVKDGN